MEFPVGSSPGACPRPSTPAPLPLLILRRLIVSVRSFFRCSTSAEPRAYGEEEQRFEGASAPPRPQARSTSGSPPYLPSGARGGESSGSGSCGSGGVSEYRRWEAAGQRHQGAVRDLPV